MSLSHRFAQLYQFAFKQRQIQNVILPHAVLPDVCVNVQFCVLKVRRQLPVRKFPFLCC